MRSLLVDFAEIHVRSKKSALKELKMAQSEEMRIKDALQKAGQTLNQVGKISLRKKIVAHCQSPSYIKFVLLFPFPETRLLLHILYRRERGGRAKSVVARKKVTRVADRWEPRSHICCSVPVRGRQGLFPPFSVHAL